MTATLPLPKYHQIYLVLREQLQEGRFAGGVPAEVVLTQQFGVGRVTVRRALEQLADEGLITREPGRGTWPTQHRGSKAVGFFEQAGPSRPNRLNGLLENLVSTSMRTTVQLREWRTISASESVASALEIPFGSKVKKVVRVRSSHEGPVSYITTYLPYELARHFGRRELSSKAILLLLLEEAGVQLGRAHQTVSARQADATVASELGVAVGSALLAVRRLVYDTDERPVQWLHGLYRPDRYEYQMEVSKVGSIDAKIFVNETLPG